MCRKSLIGLALVAGWLGITGQVRAQSSTSYQTYVSLATTYIQDAYTESYGELQTEPDDYYGAWALYFEAVCQAYLTLAGQNENSTTGKYYAYAGYQYAYASIVYAWASFYCVGYPRDNFSSYSAWIYAIGAWYYAFLAYYTWPYSFPTTSSSSSSSSSNSHSSSSSSSSHWHP